MDVVVPFRGEARQLAGLRKGLETLSVGEGDTVTVVDNTPGREPRPATHHARAKTVFAPDLQTPGFARNRGAQAGTAEWIVFLDADVVAPPSLLDRYFDSPPAERTAILAGGVRDQAPEGPRGPTAVRYAHLRRSMSQDMTMAHGDWSFVQTSNCALRRSAFEEVGGFRGEIRAGEDADLSFRLRDAGWGIERREGAETVHRSRATVRALLAQKAVHGAGCAWLDRTYPGSFPARRRPGLTWWGVRRAATGVTAAVRARDRDEALVALLDPLTTLSFEFGRSLPNERPLRWMRGSGTAPLCNPMTSKGGTAPPLQPMTSKGGTAPLRNPPGRL